MFGRSDTRARARRIDNAGHWFRRGQRIRAGRTIPPGAIVKYPRLETRGIPGNQGAAHVQRHHTKSRVLVPLSFLAGYVDACTFLPLFSLFVAQVTGSFVIVGTEAVIDYPGFFLKVLLSPAGSRRSRAPSPIAAADAV